MVVGLIIWPHECWNGQAGSKINESGIFQVDGIQAYIQDTPCGLISGVHAASYQSIETVNPGVRFAGTWHNFTGEYGNGEIIGSWEVSDPGASAKITVQNAAGPLKVRLQGTRTVTSSVSDFSAEHDYRTAPSTMIMDVSVESSGPVSLCIEGFFLLFSTARQNSDDCRGFEPLMSQQIEKLRFRSGLSYTRILRLDDTHSIQR